MRSPLIVKIVVSGDVARGVLYTGLEIAAGGLEICLDLLSFTQMQLPV